MSDLINKKQRIIAIIGASSGNLVEWFDFYVYSFCAIYFAHAFFPTSSHTAQLLNTAGVFAAGFVMRPIGGWFFGRFADRHGRRSAMMLSVFMMCGGSLAIAFMPTYSTIGTLAPVLLLVARLFQGLSVGGEYGTSATYMSEVAISGQRGFLASFQYVTLIGGQLLALLVLVVLQVCLSEAELKDWGWRIPFVAGALASLIALMLRRTLSETATATVNKKESGSLKQLMQHKQAFMRVLGFTAGGSLAFYTFTTYMQKYLVNTSGMSAKTASAIMTSALLVYMLLQPAFGALSDRIGRRQSMIWFGSLATLLTAPILLLLKQTHNPFIAFGLIISGLAIISFYTSISGLIKAEMFPQEVRALGVGLSYAIANALFGGTAEYVALGLKLIGKEEVFFLYVSVLCAICLLVSIKLPDLKKHGFLND